MGVIVLTATRYSLHSKIGGVFGCAAMTKESWRMQDCSLNSCFHLLRPRLLDYRANSPLTPPKTPLARVLSFPFHRAKSSFFPFHHAHNALKSLFFSFFFFAATKFQKEISFAASAPRQTSHLGLHGLHIRPLNPSISLHLTLMLYYNHAWARDRFEPKSIRI